MKRLAKVVGGTTAALGLMSAEGLMAQECQTCPDDVRVPADAEDLDLQSVQYEGQASALYGYLASKKSETGDPVPGVVVIHENRGFDGICQGRDTAAGAGGVCGVGDRFIVAVGRERISSADPTAAVAAYNSLSADARLQDMLSSLKYLQNLPVTAGKKIGCIGFCAGGGNSAQLAVNGGKDISAAVVFYGTPPTQVQITDQLTAPMLFLFGEQDRNFSGQLPALITNALNARKTFETHIYQGASHAFHNDTGAAYNRDAACDALGEDAGLVWKVFEGVSLRS